VGVEADGWFGPITEAAVKDYQRSKGLVPDGIVGPITMKAMRLQSVLVSGFIGFHSMDTASGRN
jgi:peptidoglycan hydrolase-like protein with peptidoglycan-binding domain